MTYLKTHIMTKLRKSEISNCDEIKIVMKFKAQMVTKLTNSNGDLTQNAKKKNSSTQNVTKLKL